MGGQSRRSRRAKLQADLAALRSLPGVVDAFATQFRIRLSDGGSTEGVDARTRIKRAARHWLPCTWATSTRLQRIGTEADRRPQLQCRRSRSTRSGYTDLNAARRPSSLPRHWPTSCFPGRSAVGQAIYVEFPEEAGAHRRASSSACRCPGRRPAAGAARSTTIRLIVPFRFVAAYIHYIVRAQAGPDCEQVHEGGGEEALSTWTARGSSRRIRR